MGIQMWMLIIQLKDVGIVLGHIVAEMGKEKEVINAMGQPMYHDRNIARSVDRYQRGVTPYIALGLHDFSKSDLGTFDVELG